MFGIGRSSPQSSLASLLTIPPTQTLQERSSEGFANVTICSDRSEDFRVSEEVSRPSDDQVTIIRGSQPPPRNAATSSQTSATNAEAPVPTGPPQTSLLNRATYDEQPTSATKVVQDTGNDVERIHTYSPAHSLLHARSAARRFVERLRRGKLWQKLRNAKSSKSHQPIRRPTTQDAQTITEPAINIMLTPNAESTIVSHTPTIAISDADEQQPHASNAVQSGGESNPNTTEALDPLASSMERIQNQRREATLKDRFLKRPTCLCGDGCHCKSDGSYPTTAAQTPDRSVALSNSDRHPLDHILLGNSNPSLPSDRGLGNNHSPTRHVTFTHNYHEPSNISIPPRIVSIEDDQQQPISRQSTNRNSTSVTSQGTTAVNSSSDGSARNIELPTLSDQHIDQLVDLFRLNTAHPRIQEALDLLRASRQPLDLSTSQQSSRNIESRTNSMSVTSEEGSLTDYAFNSRVNGAPHSSTISLSHLPETSDTPLRQANLHNSTTAGRTHSNSDATVQPHSSQNRHPSLPDQLSTDLDQLSNHNDNGHVEGPLPS